MLAGRRSTRTVGLCKNNIQQQRVIYVYTQSSYEHNINAVVFPQKTQRRVTPQQRTLSEESACLVQISVLTVVLF